MSFRKEREAERGINRFRILVDGGQGADVWKLEIGESLLEFSTSKRRRRNGLGVGDRNCREEQNVRLFPFQ